MCKIFSLLVFFLVASSSVLHAQNFKLNYNVIQQGSSQDAMGNHTSYQLSFSTESDISPFIKELKNTFGTPLDTSDQLVWKSVVLKEVSSGSFDFKAKQTDVKTSVNSWTVLFFYAKSEGGKDLLKPKTISQQKFKEYLQELVDKTIKEK